MARRCRNCPEKPSKVEASWREAAGRCSEALETMARCLAKGVPGNPMAQMERLATRLNEIIQTYEDRNASTDSVE